MISNKIFITTHTIHKQLTLQSSSNSTAYEKASTFNFHESHTIPSFHSATIDQSHSCYSIIPLSIYGADSGCQEGRDFLKQRTRQSKSKLELKKRKETSSSHGGGEINKAFTKQTQEGNHRGKHWNQMHTRGKGES